MIRDLCPGILDTDSHWAYTIKMIVRLMMRGGKARSCENVYYVLQLLDYSIPMDWYAWKEVRDGFFDYFMTAEVCKGVHQDFWVRARDVI